MSAVELLFWIACDEGEVEGLQILLDQHPSVNINFRHHDETVLVRAVKKGHGEIVSILLAHPKIDVNLECEDKSVLMHASSYKRPECVKLLLSLERNLFTDDVISEAFVESCLYLDIPCIKEFILSGRNFTVQRDLVAKIVASHGFWKVPEMIKKREETIELVESFRENREETRRRLLIK